LDLFTRLGDVARLCRHCTRNSGEADDQKDKPER
jgi:hypothetical protein